MIDEFTGASPLPFATSSPEDPLIHVTASRLKTWQECRLKWYFRYVEQVDVPVSPALLAGRAVHGVLQAWNMARWRGEDSSVPRMERIFQSCWAEGCEEAEMLWDSPEHHALEKARAWSILDHYLRHSPIPLHEKPEAVEVRVERDLLAHGLPPLLGVIDLVREGGRIVEFKTTARTPDPALVGLTHEIQLGCYALLYREATGRSESGFEVHSLVKTKTPRLVVTPLDPMAPAQVRKLVRIMESYVKGVESEDFSPSPGIQCGYCEYIDQCRRWAP